MKKFLAFSLLLPFSLSLAHAGQFDSIYNAMAIKSNADYTNAGWKDTKNIKGVKWRWQYYQSGEHDSTMQGTAKVGKSQNPNIGATDISISGSRTMLDTVSIEVSNEVLPIHTAFSKIKLVKIPTTCDIEDKALESLNFYKTVKIGYKPLYLRHESSWGASGSGGESIKLAYYPEALFSDYEDCKIQ